MKCVQRIVVCLLFTIPYLGVTGCRTSGTREEGGLLRSRGNDPLFGSRIPPQDIPMPGRDRDGYGSGNKRDPLYAVPAKSDDRGRHAEAGGSREISSAPKSDVPYRPGRESTNAALATAGGLLPVDDVELSMGKRSGDLPDRRTSGDVVGRSRGPVPLTPRETADRGDPSPVDLDRVLEDLKKLGARVEAPLREDGQYVVRADVPRGPDQPGAVRRYEGTGPTPAAAARQLLGLIRDDQ